MSLCAWLTKRLSPFFRWLWLGKSDALAQVRKPKNTHKAKAPARLEVMLYDRRDVPQDMFAVLSGGHSLLGMTLIPGDLGPLWVAFHQSYPLPRIDISRPSAAHGQH